MQATDILPLDGSSGEGGGQILRTALSLSTLTGRAFRLVNIRLRRAVPGLLAQHLSAVQGAAAISGATVSGNRLGSTEIRFVPGHAPKAGTYVFDVAETAQRGSAGSVTLILETLVLPLATADADSTVIVRGGTHVEWSPPFDDFAYSYLPTLRKIGFRARAELKRWGWYPVGGGEVVCSIGRFPRRDLRGAWPQANGIERGALRRIGGRAVAANLPAHIPQRMALRAQAALAGLAVPVEIQAESVAATCPGAGIFLLAEYESLTASFSAYGKVGRPAEAVADQAAAALREHHASGAAVEMHLADQLLLPLAVAAGPCEFTVARATGHLMTNAWTIGQFGVADITIEQGAICRVRVEPRALPSIRTQ
jgi:RNA 3'-terminal phosphate cyclase (ATP)